MKHRPIKSPRALVSMATVVLTATAAPAWAGEHSRDERREQRQETRIAGGVASGELTRPETRRLLRQQHRLDHAQDAARADGKVGLREAAALERLQDRNSRAIARQKHDRQERPGR
jgi:hypothetical protein